MKSFLVATVDREFKKIEKQRPHPPRRFVRGEEGEKKGEERGERVDVSESLTQTLLTNIGHRDWTTRRFLSFFFFYELILFFFLPYACSFYILTLFFFYNNPTETACKNLKTSFSFTTNTCVSLPILPLFLPFLTSFLFPYRCNLKDFLLLFLL